MSTIKSTNATFRNEGDLVIHGMRYPFSSQGMMMSCDEKGKNWSESIRTGSIQCGSVTITVWCHRNGDGTYTVVV